MLDISPAMMLVTVTTFLVTLFLLNKILYQPLLDFMKKREDSIALDSENTTKNASDVGEFYQEAERILKEAKLEASKLKTEALNEVKDSMSKQIESRKAELETEYEAFLTGLQQEKLELKNALIAQMPIFKDSVKAKLSQI